MFSLPVQWLSMHTIGVSCSHKLLIKNMPNITWQSHPIILLVFKSSYWRKGWDLNPRTALTAYPLSRRASSTSLSTPPNIMAEKRGFEPPEGDCPLQQISNLPPSTYSATSPYSIGGGGGIRTHATLKGTNRLVGGPL